MSSTRGPASSFYDLPTPWAERMQARLDRRPWFGAGMLYALPVLLMLMARWALVPTLSDAEAERLLAMRHLAVFYGPEYSPLPLWLGGLLLKLGAGRLAVLLPEALLLWAVLMAGYATARLWLAAAPARFAGASLLLLTPLSTAFPLGGDLALPAAFAILSLVAASVRVARYGDWGSAGLLAFSLALCLTGGRGSLLFALVFLICLGLDRDLRVERHRHRLRFLIGAVGGAVLAAPYLFLALRSLHQTPLLLLLPPPEVVEALPRALLHGWSVLAERAVLDLMFWAVGALLLAPALLRPSRPADVWPGMIAQSCAATLMLLAGATLLERGPIISDSGPLACLVLVPLLIFSAIDRMPVAAWRRLALATLIAVVAVSGPVGLLIDDRLLLPTCATCRQDADFARLAAHLGQLQAGPLAIPDPWIAGNLWRVRPDLVAAPGARACQVLQTDAAPLRPAGPVTPLMLPRQRYSGAGVPLILAPMSPGACS